METQKIKEKTTKPKAEKETGNSEKKDGWPDPYFTSAEKGKYGVMWRSFGIRERRES